MQVLEDHQERLHLALAEEQALDGSSVRWRRWGGSRRSRRHLDRHVQQREERRQDGLERAVQRQELARHLLADLARVVARLDLNSP